MRRDELEARLERHHADCYGWALNCCGWDEAEAEDVLQTSYLKVLDGRATFDGRSAFRTWLFGVIRLTALERRRRRERRRSLLSSWISRGGDDGLFRRTAGGPDGATPGAETGRSQPSARLVRALRSLSPRQREVLHLVFYEGMTIREAAETLEISLGTARTHYERGKERLRERLGEAGEEGRGRSRRSDGEDRDGDGT